MGNTVWEHMLGHFVGRHVGTLCEHMFVFSSSVAESKEVDVMCGYPLLLIEKNLFYHSAKDKSFLSLIKEPPLDHLTKKHLFSSRKGKSSSHVTRKTFFDPFAKKNSLNH